MNLAVEVFRYLNGSLHGITYFLKITFIYFIRILSNHSLSLKISMAKEGVSTINNMEFNPCSDSYSELPSTGANRQPIPDAQQIEEMFISTRDDFGAFAAEKVRKLNILGKFNDTARFLQSAQKFEVSLHTAYDLAVKYKNTPQQFWSEIKRLLHEHNRRVEGIDCEKPLQQKKSEWWEGLPKLGPVSGESFPDNPEEHP